MKGILLRYATENFDFPKYRDFPKRKEKKKAHAFSPLSVLTFPISFTSSSATAAAYAGDSKSAIMSIAAIDNGLTTPFLPVSSPEVIVDIVDDTNTTTSTTVIEPAPLVIGSDANPYKLMGAPSFSLPPPCPIDPFRNHTERITGLYEWLKILVCFPIAVVRLVLFGVAIAVGFVATTVALQGWKDKQNPMPRWRCRIMWITRICARCILFSFGYHWIKRKGRPAPREIAPVVVSNHVCYIEPIFFFYELFPTMVSSESHDSIPFVGTIIRAMQVIYVDRFSAPSRKLAVSEIKRKASSDKFPRVLLFPEGTTTNGRSLISFQLGAFIPGLPVQPIVVRYPYVHFDQSWGNISLLKLMFRMFTQFHNYMEVEYLPVVNPPSGKLDSATHFAEKTSFAIASALNAAQTCHSFGDVMLFTKALQLTKGKPSHYMVEMARVQNTYGISTLEAMEFLDKFLTMNPDPSGRVKAIDFVTTLKLGSCALASKIFDFIDVQKKGSITFRQYLLGSAHILSQPAFHHICEAILDASRDKENGDTASQKITDLIRLYGICEDGVVNRDEFMTFIRRNPLLIALFVPFYSRIMVQ